MDSRAAEETVLARSLSAIGKSLFPIEETGFFYWE